MADARRLKVVVCGFPTLQWQPAVDATLVGALHADGSARPRAAIEDGAAIVAAKRRKTHLPGVGAPGQQCSTRGSGRQLKPERS